MNGTSVQLLRHKYTLGKSKGRKEARGSDQQSHYRQKKDDILNSKSKIEQ